LSRREKDRGATASEGKFHFEDWKVTPLDMRREVQVQNKGDGLVQNIGNTLIKVFGSDKLLDALEKEWTYGSTDGVCVESVAGG
jgi:hypothetical protein